MATITAESVTFDVKVKRVYAGDDIADRIEWDRSMIADALDRAGFTDIRVEVEE